MICQNSKLEKISKEYSRNMPFPLNLIYEFKSILKRNLRYPKDNNHWGLKSDFESLFSEITTISFTNQFEKNEHFCCISKIKPNHLGIPPNVLWRQFLSSQQIYWLHEMCESNSRIQIYSKNSNVFLKFKYIYRSILVNNQFNQFSFNHNFTCSLYAPFHFESNFFCQS